MQTITIKKVITKKLNDWLETINDEKLRKEVKDNLLVSGGCITSLFLNEPVNDFDVYIQDMNVLVQLAEYYCPKKILDGRLKEQYIADYLEDKKHIDFDKDKSSTAVVLKNLKKDQVRISVGSQGERFEIKEDQKYQISFLSPNAISLTDDLQIVLRFNGSAEQIHKNFDYIHATNYFTFKDGLVTNILALECVLTKQLKYQGSLYPLTSIIRIKKFIKRGWNINAGEMVKIMFQVSDLDLTDPEVLEEQLIGVDIAYFSKLIEIIRDLPEAKITSAYLNSLIDRVFNHIDEA